MKTCFVIMPIGDQAYGKVTTTKVELRKRYDDLIAEAIKKADPELEVSRADDVSLPGSITTDILTRIMHSTCVVADIIYPNPNVFYELGLRHAVRNKTILLKEANSSINVFDISHLRHIEYENTPTGLKELSQKLKETFEWMSKNPHKLDITISWNLRHSPVFSTQAITKVRKKSRSESPWLCYNSSLRTQNF